MNKLTEKIFNFLPQIITLIIILILLGTIFVSLGIQDHFNFFKFAISFVLLTTTYTSYIKTGVKIGRSSEVYINSASDYNSKIGLVHQKNLNNKVMGFCDYINQLNQEIVIRDKLARVGIIDEDMVKKVTLLTDEELSKFSKRQLKVIRKIKKGLKIPKVTYSQLMINSYSKSQLYSSENNSKSKMLFWFVYKVLNFVIISLFFGYIAITTTGDNWQEKIYEALLYICSIITAIWSSVYNSYKVVINDEVDALNRRSELLQQFIILQESSPTKDV